MLNILIVIAVLALIVVTVASIAVTRSAGRVDGSRRRRAKVLRILVVVVGTVAIGLAVADAALWNAR
jgi:hypothetical protein